MNYPSVTTIIRYQLREEYPYDPSGYYLKRGRFLGGGKDDRTGESFPGACDILAVGGELDERTIEVLRQVRRKPLARNEESATEVWMDYVDRFREFLEEYVPRTFVRLAYPAGLPVVNEVEQYCGHPDQIWEMAEDGRQAVIDLKTGTAPGWTKWQTAFYDLGLPLNKRRRRFALQLQPTAFKLIEYTDSRDYDACRIFARAYHLAMQYGGEK